MQNKPIFIPPILIFVISLIFYIILLSPGIDYGDGATFVTKALHFKFEARATSHPLYYLICKLFFLLPFGSMAWKVNLLSAVSSASCLAVTYCLLRNLKLNQVAILTGISALALSHTFWLKSCIPDVYTLQALLAVSSFYCIIKWNLASQDKNSKSDYWLIAWAMVWGLSLMHHFLLAFLLPGQILYVILNRKNIANIYRFIGLFTISFLAVSYIWWHIAIVQIINGENLISLLTGGGGVESKVGGYKLFELPKAIILSIILLAYQFPWLLSAIGIYGAVTQNQKSTKVAWMLNISFILTTLFAVTYKSNHKYEVFIQSYLIFAIWIAYGANSLLEKYPIKKKILYIICIASVFLQPISYFLTTKLIERCPNLLPIAIRNVPYRNNFTHFFWPPKYNAYGAERYGQEVMNELPKNAVIIADWTLLTVLLHMQEIEGMRPDVKIVFLETHTVSEIIKKDPNRPVCAADNLPCYKLNELPKCYKIKNCGNFFQIIKDL